MSEATELNNYDSEPVRYCANCYSLKVKYDESTNLEYCGDCGCLDIHEAPIEEWEKKYERRYGHKFTEKQEDPKKTFVFSLTTEELKTKIYNSEKWKSIIKSIYPRFPGGLSKADAIILFFHHIIQDNKLNDLKFLLFKLIKY